VMAMLEALVDERSEREVWWLYGARNSREHAFAAEVEGLLSALPNARKWVYYSRPRRGDVVGHGFDGRGRLSGSVLAGLEPPAASQAYLCGPVPFMDDMSAALSSLGIEASHIHTEPFGPAPGQTPGIVTAASPRAPHPPAGAPGTGPTIEFARSDLSIRWSEDYPSLLELAEACDVPVRWSCRTGVCQTCETTLIAGGVAYSPDPVEQPPDGSVLICCSQPRGDIVLDL